jgi:hypothetical protein
MAVEQESVAIGTLLWVLGIADMIRWKTCIYGLIVVFAGVPAKASLVEELGTICQVHSSSEPILVERNANGAERFTIDPSTYFLRYDGRVYLSTTRRQKNLVFDLTMYEGLTPNDSITLSNSTAISVAAYYVRLADQAPITKIITPNYNSLSSAICTIGKIAPERFTVQSLPINADALRQ